LLRYLCHVLLYTHAASRGFAAINPGGEVLRQQLRECQQVTEVSLGIDADGRHAIYGRLFKQRAQAGLATAVMPTHTAWVVRSRES
jgi:hypothetical protein